MPVFDSTPDSVIGEFIDLLEEQEFTANSIIFYENSPLTGVYFIYKGLVEISTTMEDQ